MLMCLRRRQHFPVVSSQRFDMDLDQIDCTPDTKRKLPSNKSMAGQIPQEGSPTATSPFLQWRLTAEEEDLQVNAMEKIARSEATMFFAKAGTNKGRDPG